MVEISRVGQFQDVSTLRASCNGLSRGDLIVNFDSKGTEGATLTMKSKTALYKTLQEIVPGARGMFPLQPSTLLPGMLLWPLSFSVCI